MADKANVLKTIVEHKRAEVQQRKLKRSLEELKLIATVNQRSFEQALRQPGSRFILEYKRASPSRGDIRPNFSVDDCIAAYEASADCYSVLTDSKFFNGNHLLLKAICERTRKPVLCKDFFVDEYQVYEARAYGASAVLLMLSVLSDDEYRRLAEIAERLNLDVLTEVHTEEECIRARELNAKIIGINNRDLRSLQTDLANTERLRKILPVGAVIISESGIESRDDVQRLAPLVDGFLVGSSLMSAPNVGTAARSLVYGDVKICGVKSSNIARICFDSGANYVGLMFYSSSSRYITPQQASEIASTAVGNYVGVFVNHQLEDIVQVNQQCRLEVVQLHGDESMDFARLLKQQLPLQKVWKAIPVTNQISVEEIKHWLDVVDKVVLDCKSDGLYGGSGKSFNWQLLDELFKQVEQERIVIAGGISESNIGQLKRYTQCVVDLSSGVEETKGEKSSEKIRQLFNVIRSAS